LEGKTCQIGVDTSWGITMLDKLMNRFLFICLDNFYKRSISEIIHIRAKKWYQLSDWITW